VRKIGDRNLKLQTAMIAVRYVVAAVHAERTDRGERSDEAK
jgi:hypothetical protein